MMTLSNSDYSEKTAISFYSKATEAAIVVSPSAVIETIVKANKYLHALTNIFNKADFYVYRTLGKRNMSGFVGEVFANFFARTVKGFIVNPHPDGRPDLLDVTSKEAHDYYSNSCFGKSRNGESAPIKSALTPFQFGGLEVKATIGQYANKAKDKLLEEKGVTSLSVGISRIDCIRSLTYWGHHLDCVNLLGVYYDYFEELNGTPQIMAVMHSELDPKTDWHVVSKGKKKSKKTSNTSLTLSGIAKIMHNPIAVTNDSLYYKKLKQIGLNI